MAGGSLAEDGESQEPAQSSYCAPVDHRAARTRHPDAVAVDAAVEIAAILVLLKKSPERVEQYHFAFGPRGSTVPGRQA